MVLTRREGEGVTVTLEDGRTIRVVVIEQGRGRVRLGFSAPATVIIARDELLPPAKDEPDDATH